MPKTNITPNKKERALAKEIVSNTPGSRVVFGRTNGKTVLHVAISASTRREASAVTIKDSADWYDSPLNPAVIRKTRAQREAEEKSVLRELEDDLITNLIANDNQAEPLVAAHAIKALTGR